MQNAGLKLPIRVPKFFDALVGHFRECRDNKKVDRKGNNIVAMRSEVKKIMPMLNLNEF